MSKRAPETNILITALKRCYEENRMATYTELETFVTGCATIQRNYLVGALRIVREDYGYLFKCVNTVGYKPIANETKVAEIERIRLSKIRSQVNKFEEDLGCVSVIELSEQEQKRYYSAQVRVSCHQMILSEKLDKTYEMAGQKCVAAGKIDFDLGDFQDAFKALKMN